MTNLTSPPTPPHPTRSHANSDTYHGSSPFTCRMSVDAYSNAEFLSPDRWHSMTVDVSTGTMCVGNREMLLATLNSIRAAPSWSPRRTIFFTCGV